MDAVKNAVITASRAVLFMSRFAKLRLEMLGGPQLDPSLPEVASAQKEMLMLVLVLSHTPE